MHYTTEAILWRHPGEAAWYFLTIDPENSQKIKESAPKRGWGSVKVEATIGHTTWETSIFPGKIPGYLLPVKANVRKAEQLKEGDLITAQLRLL